MKFIAILAAILLLSVPTMAFDDLVYAVGMGMYAKEIQYEADFLKAQYDSGEIDMTDYQEKLDAMNKYANYFNKYLKGNFNNTIYQKWKLPIYSV